MERLMTAVELAEKLGIPESRVYAMARERTMPSVRLGRLVRFVPTAIEAWIAAGGSALPGGWKKEPGGPT